MARVRDPNRDRAFELYKKHQGNIDLVEIANQLSVPPGTVRGWKAKDKWEKKLNGTFQKNTECSIQNMERFKEKKVLNQKTVLKEEKKIEQDIEILDNSELTDKQKLFCVHYIKCFNATKAAVKAGYSRDSAGKIGYQLLEKTRIKEEILRLKQNKLNRAMLSPEDIFQRFMDIAYGDITDYAKFGKKDIEMGKTEDGKPIIVKVNYMDFKESDEVDGSLISEVKQGKDGVSIKLHNQVKALEWLAAHMDMATEEQRVRIEKIKLDIGNAKKQQEEKVVNYGYNGIPANMVSPVFARVLFDIENHGHDEYVFPGGRGSTKSSFISLNIVDLIEKNPEMHAAVYRQVGDTLRDSVYAQLCWAIQSLGLEDEYKCTVSPMEITKKSTGQKIFFRGCDDPMKSKGIKAPFGYIGILWFEELDQYRGPEAVRTVTQSVIRGGDKCYIFKSFNPPKSATNWANKYIKIPKESMLVTESTYLDVPKQWLGKVFLEEAEFLKETNPAAYENEYMGVANGSGGNIFDNIEIRVITDFEINQFDRLYFGLDFGWFPDPNAWTKCYYNASKHELYVFDEHRCNKTSNEEMHRILTQEKHMTPNDLLICDSAEQKSIEDLKAYGLFTRGAIKGPGSVEYSMKWLQSLSKIIIDNARCPYTTEEFLNYEYERDKEGNIISGYPDKDNHFIDSVRYALNNVWKKRGQ